MKVIIEGRHTDHGASTTIVAWTNDVEVKIDNVSGSGKHWEETAVGPEDGLIVVQDISNSGKHNCYIQQMSGHRVNVSLPEGASCVCELTNTGLIRAFWPEGDGNLAKSRRLERVR